MYKHIMSKAVLTTDDNNRPSQIIIGRVHAQVQNLSFEKNLRI